MNWRDDMGRPQGARTPPPGPCLSALRLPGAEVGDLRLRLRSYRTRCSIRPSWTRSRYRDRHGDTDEARAVRLAPGTYSLNLRWDVLGEYDGREANCSPVWIDVRWTIRGQSDPERDNYLSGMIPSAWCWREPSTDAKRSTRDGGRVPATNPA